MISKLIPLLSPVLFGASSADVPDLFSLPGAMEYTHLPRVWEGEFHKLRPIGLNTSALPDPSGSPNNEYPWRHAGGTDRMKNVKHRRVIVFPKNGTVDVWPDKYRTTLPNGVIWASLTRVSGRFPVGTRVAEYMYHKGRLFEYREREKVGDGDWSTEQISVGERPPGYVEVDNCVECHEDIGTHAKQLDPNRHWYGTVRGLEVGGPIHWHPWTRSQRHTVREELAHLVRILDRPPRGTKRIHRTKAVRRRIAPVASIGDIQDRVSRGALTTGPKLVRIPVLAPST